MRGCTLHSVLHWVLVPPVYAERTLPFPLPSQAMSKEDLYGVLDPNTREWTDGLFTHILRK